MKTEAMKIIRWKQRFENLEKAFHQLEFGMEIEEPNPIEVQGIIQAFEFTFELSWKTLKDFLESEGIIAKSPREVIKHGFALEYISNGEIWIDMLEKRNLLTHTYLESIAVQANEKIHGEYFVEIKKFIDFLHTQK